MITAMWSVMIIPASVAHRATGSNPSPYPKRLLETLELALLSLQLLTVENCEGRWCWIASRVKIGALIEKFLSCCSDRNSCLSLMAKQS